MKRLIIMAALAVAALGFNEASAQKVIKDAAGAVYIDVQDMPVGAFSTTTLNKIALSTDADNSVYKKLQIAKADLVTKTTWAEACGIAMSYNSAIAIGQTQGQVSTGCRAYSAEGNTGSWRVPTQRELQLMWIMNDVLTQAGVSTFAVYYWPSTEDTATTSWAVNFSLGTTTNATKTGTLITTRCVREVN